MIEFAALTAKTWSYLIDHGSLHKKAKGTKKCVIKENLKLNDYKNCLFNNRTILKPPQKFNGDYHNVYTEEINNIALSSNDHKILRTFDKITTYSYGTNTFKACESEMLSKYK